MTRANIVIVLNWTFFFTFHHCHAHLTSYLSSLLSTQSILQLALSLIGHEDMHLNGVIGSSSLLGLQLITVPYV